MTERAGDLQHSLPRLGGIALPPVGTRNPVSEFDVAFVRVDSDAADHRRVTGARDQKAREHRLDRQSGKTTRILRAIGPGCAREIANHAFIGDSCEYALPVFGPDRSEQQVLTAVEHRNSPLRPAPVS